MTKLTPARKALLQKLMDAGGHLGWTMLTIEECLQTATAQAGGLCRWMYAGGRITITEAGRAALKEAGA